MRLSHTALACICVLILAPTSSPGQEEEPEWIEVSKVLASDGAGGALFGDAAALDGDRLAVGAPRAGGNDPGAVYVYERHAGGPSQWGEVARFEPLTQPADLGGAVAIMGDTIAATALIEGEQGAAYVFERQADGSWSRTRLLPPDQPGTFGNGIATDGEQVFVGAAADDDAGTNAGAVYVYEHDAGGPGNWGLVAKLTAADPLNQANFGTAIAVDDGVLVVGARRDSGMVGAGGAVHIFEHSEGGGWIDVAKVHPSDGGDDDKLGEAVAVDGWTVVVGSPDHAHRPPTTDPSAFNLAGAVYVLERDESGQWLEIAELIHSDVESGDHFGRSVAVRGDTIVGGAELEDLPGAGSGAAYIFQRDAGGPDAWSEVAKLESSDSHDIQNFGTAVAVDGGTVVVGAHGDDELGNSAGAAYVFRLLDLDLTVTGACPGEISLAVTGAAPHAPVGLLWSDAAGTKVLPPGGPCEGMELGLEEPRLLSLVPADADGELALTRTASPGVCGRFLQTVEVGICNPSNTAQIP